MSRNYNHGYIGRNSRGGKRKNGKNLFKLFFLIIVILALLFFLGKDITLPTTMLHEDITTKVNRGEFSKRS